jgi:hypothetical protein
MIATPSPRVPWFADLSPRQFCVIVGSFWTYVTISNLLYAYSMRAGIAGTGGAAVFACWQARLLQHVLLLPCLVTSYWASLRVQWRPALTAAPVQLLLACGFAALAYPAMMAANLAVDRSQWSAHGMEPWGLHALTDASLQSMWLASFVSFLPAYGFGLALVTGLALYARFKSAQLRLATLEREWSAARLAALRMQLSPHALFNLLNTIRGAIDWDPRGAQAMVIQLAALLRQLLKAGAREMSPLVDEMHFVGLYLELQQRRFSDRLRIELPDPSGCPPVWVPSLILQPLVENAVVHGLAGHAGTVVVRVELAARDGRITLRVRNTLGVRNALGVRNTLGVCNTLGVRNTLAASDLPTADGIGLKNVRERLNVHFGAGATFTAGLHAEEWLSEICLPDLRDTAPNAISVEARNADAVSAVPAGVGSWT